MKYVQNKKHTEIHTYIYIAPFMLTNISYYKFLLIFMRLY